MCCFKNKKKPHLYKLKLWIVPNTGLFLIGQNCKSLITRHLVIVERCNTACWNRLIETV
jgi:hypothetical protein